MKKQFANEMKILDLLTKIQEQLTALDRKMDSLTNTSSPRSMEQRLPIKPASPPPPAPPSAQVQRREMQNNRYNVRPMYRATCADCQKECEIPFQPRGDRPVYCQECFRQRKAGNTFNAASNNKPQGAPSISAVMNPGSHISEPPGKEKKKSSGTKKNNGKKKLIFKKSKAKKGSKK